MLNVKRPREVASQNNVSEEPATKQLKSEVPCATKQLKSELSCATLPPMPKAPVPVLAERVNTIDYQPPRTVAEASSKPAIPSARPTGLSVVVPPSSKPMECSFSRSPLLQSPLMLQTDSMSDRNDLGNPWAYMSGMQNFFAHTPSSTPPSGGSSNSVSFCLTNSSFFSKLIF